MVLPFDLSIFMCSYCTRVFNDTKECEVHETVIHPEITAAIRTNGEDELVTARAGSTISASDDGEIVLGDNVDHSSPTEVEDPVKEMPPVHMARKRKVEQVANENRRIEETAFRSKVVLPTHEYKTSNRHFSVKQGDLFACSKCQATFPTMYKMKLHRSLVHSQSCKQYTCDICDEKFPMKSKLNRHHKLEHTVMKKLAVKMFCCFVQDCDSTFSSISLMQGHLADDHDYPI